MSREKQVSGGVGLGSVLFIVFLVLKLTGTIDWSWLWITSPLWIPFVIALAILLVVIFVMGIILLIAVTR